VSHAVQLGSERNLLALVVSLALHASLVLSFVAGRQLTTRTTSLPESVAMPGNAIEVEAPTPELAAVPASPEPAPEPEAATNPVDVRSLPTEAVAPAPDAAQTPTVPKPAPARPHVEPRPRAETEPKKPAPVRAANDSAAPQAGSDAPTSATPASGTFGQEGLAPGVRRLGYAFTRAIPAATPADGAWQELPAGHVGTIRIELDVDESNRLGALKRWQARPGEPPPPAALQRLVERTLILLRAGQFALSGSNHPGSERLTIDVTLRDEAADADSAPGDVVQKKFDGAAPGRPGKAYFRYGSGRAFEARVTVAASGN
jgi:outer membrane biosynthesis protein TonB